MISATGRPTPLSTKCRCPGIAKIKAEAGWGADWDLAA